MLQCWKCKKTVSELPIQIGFRAQCQHCEADLHTCLGCRYYAPGKPNDCNVPGTEWVKDREVMNFCEEFAPKLTSSQKEHPKKHFNSLFKDE